MNIGQLLTSEQDALTSLVTEACNGQHVEPRYINSRINVIKAIKLWLEVIPHPEYGLVRFCDAANVWGLEQNTLTGEHDTEAQQELNVYADALNTLERHTFPF
jgi:hypothetical protein